MRLGWIDPLPVVDAVYPLGLDPSPESIPAGEIELRFDLPEIIAQPFCDLIESVGDRLELVDDDKERCQNHLRAQSYFKAARQLYSTMRDFEKAVNQPLKAVYYDETPIPLHLAGALGIIGHMDTKVGQVIIKHAGVLFKRWVAKGLQCIYGNSKKYKGDCSKLIWYDRECLEMLKSLARERIAVLVKQTYTLSAEGHSFTVSMPQLADQELDLYYSQINNSVPNADDLRSLVAILGTDLQSWKDDDLPHNQNRDDVHRVLGVVPGDGAYDVSSMRSSFEELTALYTTDIKWRIESIFKTGPPPAGSTGYGAQTVSYEQHRAVAIPTF